MSSLANAKIYGESPTELPWEQEKQWSESN